MKNLLNKFYYLTIVLLYPLLAGCKGGGDSTSTGGTVTSGLSQNTQEALVSTSYDTFASTAVDSATTASIATIHNPEPTTMLLMGGGLVAMAAYKKYKKTHVA